MPHSNPASRSLSRVRSTYMLLATSNQLAATSMAPRLSPWVSVRCSRKTRFTLCRAFHIWAYRAFILVVVAMLSSSCATPHATLNFTAPSSTTAGVPFTVTVTVLYKGMPDTIINSQIHFTSSDPAAVLPPDYYFTPTDAGSHTWTNGFTLSTAGNQTISGSIFNATGINGAATIAVAP
jgi:hypothetical protein